MPTVDVVDETFVVAPPSVLAAAIADPASWLRWWPDLTLTVFADRGEEGIRWTVSGVWTGSMEMWLEAVGDGTVVHYFLRADPTDPADAPPSERGARREALRRQKAAKRIAFALKDQLEGDRPPGVPPPPGAPAPPPSTAPSTAPSTDGVTPRTPASVTHVPHAADQGSPG